MHRYFTSEELFKPYFLGVFPLDEIKHVFDSQQLSKRIKNNGCFFICNSNPSYKDGEHLQLIMRLSEDHLFGFDSFGSSSFNQKIPLSFINCNVIFENATAIDSNKYIEMLSLNYNEVNLTIEQNINQNTQFYYFTEFLPDYSTENNLKNVLISCNCLPYQKPSTVLCGAWCAYFAWQLFIDIIYKYKQETLTLTLTHFKYVLKTHFEESVYQNLPFKIYITETFLK